RADRLEVPGLHRHPGRRIRRGRGLRPGCRVSEEGPCLPGLRAAIREGRPGAAATLRPEEAVPRPVADCEATREALKLGSKANRGRGGPSCEATPRRPGTDPALGLRAGNEVFPS